MDSYTTFHLGALEMEFITRDTFDDWISHPVTSRIFDILRDDREEMKEGLVNNIFDNEDEVKGRCRAIALLLNLSYEDLFQSAEVMEKNKHE
jgi:hypothetical protein